MTMRLKHVLDHLCLIRMVRRALDLLAKLVCICQLLSLLANLCKRDRQLAGFDAKSSSLPDLGLLVLPSFHF